MKVALARSPLRQSYRPTCRAPHPITSDIVIQRPDHTSIDSPSPPATRGATYSPEVRRTTDVEVEVARSVVSSEGGG